MKKNLILLCSLFMATALQKIGEGAFNGTVTRSGSAYTKDWTAGAGTMITYADVQ